MSALRSTLGAKLVVALTGAGLLLFVVGHMAGNLQIFGGQDMLNGYAAALKSAPGLLWAARLGLIALAVTHIVKALLLAARNNSARPIGYQAAGNVQKTPSARSMVLTGLLIAAFVVFHLAHFTWGWILTDAYSLKDELGRHDVYSMTVAGFQQLPIAAIYIVAMFLLALHIRHGAWSVFQTLGVNPPRIANWVSKGATGLAWLILIGNVSMPLAVQLGVIGLPPGVVIR